MNWNDAVRAANEQRCDQCQNEDECAAVGACVAYLEDEIVLEAEHDSL